MLIKTKKYQLDKNDYIRFAFIQLLRKQWWFVALPICLFICAFLLPGTGWWITGGSVTIVGYFLFWIIQFAGVTQLQQGQIMFQKMSYEITSQQIMMKINDKQGMPIKWEQILSALSKKDYFIISLSKAQFIHLPHKIFNNQNEIKFFESILKRKNLIK